MPINKRMIDILSLTPIEKHALLESRDLRRKTFATYLAMREKISLEFLPLISNCEPYMNDHSRNHLSRVLSHIESILARNFPREDSKFSDIPDASLISWADTLILLNALVWHDIGNIYGRRNHAERAHECLVAIAEKLYDEHLREYIVQVAEAHSGEDAIGKKISSSHAALSYQGQSIHLQFLAALLRFADEIDEDFRRAEPNEWDQMDLLPAENRRFWYFSKCNAYIRISAVAEEHNFALWLNVGTHVPRTQFDRQFVSDAGEVRALTEYFRRLFKFERERVYCNGYLKTAYYHSGIQGFKINLRTHEHGAAPNTGKELPIELSDTADIESLLSNSELSDLHAYIEEARELS